MSGMLARLKFNINCKGGETRRGKVKLKQSPAPTEMGNPAGGEEEKKRKTSKDASVAIKAEEELHSQKVQSFKAVRP